MSSRTKKQKVVNVTIVHKLWDCVCTNLFLQFLLNEEKVWTGRDESLNMVEYLFGTDDYECDGTNHFLLELKLFLFYDFLEGESLESTIGRFYNKLRNIIIKEKNMAKGDFKYEKFVEKWKYFTSIYDFRGPDVIIVL